MYQKLQSDDVRFLRYSVRQEKWHIEVGAPPKNQTFAMSMLMAMLIQGAIYVRSSEWPLMPCKNNYNNVIQKLKINDR